MKYEHAIAWIIIALCLALAIYSALAIHSARANGPAGVSGRISDVPQTVQSIEDRADIRWAITTAREWEAEDWSACVDDRNWAHTSEDFTRCMVRRSYTRILYMLRRDCTGVSTIASACKMEVK